MFTSARSSSWPAHLPLSIQKTLLLTWQHTPSFSAPVSPAGPAHTGLLHFQSVLAVGQCRPVLRHRLPGTTALKRGNPDGGGRGSNIVGAGRRGRAREGAFPRVRAHRAWPVGSNTSVSPPGEGHPAFSGLSITRSHLTSPVRGLRCVVNASSTIRTVQLHVNVGVKGKNPESHGEGPCHTPSDKHAPSMAVPTEALHTRRVCSRNHSSYRSGRSDVTPFPCVSVTLGVVTDQTSTQWG